MYNVLEKLNISSISEIKQMIYYSEFYSLFTHNELYKIQLSIDYLLVILFSFSFIF